MIHVIKHPQKGYWQAAAGWYPKPENATKYESQEEAHTVILFNSAKFIGADAITMMEVKHAIPR